MISPAEAPAVPEPPLPSCGSAMHRWRHTRLRRRMLTGRWDDDLRALVNAAAGPRRASAWRMVDLSANVFRSSMQQVAVQYDRAPFVLHTDPAGQELAGLARKAKLWQLMARFQRDALGCRENLLRVDVVGGRPLYRPVSGDFVEAEAAPEDPARPVWLREAMLRTRHHPARGRRAARDEELWTWDEWDISDPNRPRVRVTDERGHDLSREFLLDAEGNPAPEGGLTGDAYGWRDDNNNAVLPYVVYHAQHTGQLWDPYEARELVAGSLNIALMWSFWGHIVRSSAWSKRYGINVRPIGAEMRGAPGQERQVQEDDPATIALYEADDATGQPVLGQFGVVADPMVVAEAVALYERRIAAFAGISPSDVQRVAGDPRSGFALSISREAIRESQQRFEPHFMAGDEEALQLTAWLLNRATGSSYPAEGYGLSYQTVPLSVEEQRSLREHVLELLDRGLIDRVSAYQAFNPGVSDEEAVEALERIRLINETTSGPAPTPQPAGGAGGRQL